MAEIKRVKVKFLDSIAGLRDPSPTVLEAKYKKLEEQLRAEKNGKLPAFMPAQIATKIAAERAKDEAVILTGFQKDWSFKPDQEAYVSLAIAEVWEKSGQVLILPQAPKGDK